MTVDLRVSEKSATAWRFFAVLVIFLGACKGERGTAGTSGTTPTVPTSTALTKWDDAPGVVLAITAISGATGSGGTFKAGDTIVVTFTAKKTDGSNWSLSELSNGRILVSGPTFNYQRVIAEQSNLLTAAADNGDGTYTYTFATTIPSTYLAPYNDSTTFGSGDGELQGQALLAGTYTVGMYCYWAYTVDGTTYKDVGQTTGDFLFGGSTTLAPREVVKSDNCNRCHNAVQSHDGERRTTALCVLCHTSGAEDNSGNHTSIDLRVMIHKMHDGAHLPSVLGVGTNSDGSRNYAATATPYVLVDEDAVSHDYSEIAWPVWPNLNTSMPRDYGYSALSSGQKTLEGTMLQGATQCSKCHGDPDDSGPLTAPSQGDVHKTQPSRRACGSCHDDINWTYPYVANQLTMAAQTDDSNCLTCHASSGAASAGNPLSTASAHLHPVVDTAISPGMNFAITGIAGGSGAGGEFQADDKPSITFTVKDDAGTNVPLGSLDQTVTILVGPNYNRQFVFPFASANGASSGFPVDFSGRLLVSSTSNRPTMSKVVGAAVTETLYVMFSSTTAFTVNKASDDSQIGSGTLAAATNTSATGVTIGTVELTSSAVAQNITVDFSDSTNFTVLDGSSNSMGTGALPASTSSSMQFVSSDGTVSFIITASGSATITASTLLNLTVVQCTGANPVLFAIMPGTTALAASDRFYYDTVAPASSYTYPLPMDIPLETLGDGTNTIGQNDLVAANLPVYLGRQSLSLRSAVSGGSTTITGTAAAALDRYVSVASTTNFAAGDNVVIERGAGLAAEEHIQIGFVDTTSSPARLYFRTPLRFAHATTSTVEECTLTFKRLGVDYDLAPSTGTITTLAAFPVGQAVVMSYRTDGRFGWYRYNGDTRQDSYSPPVNDSSDQDQSWGDWSGLSFADGTYTAAIWGRKNHVLGLQNEVQTYNDIGDAGTFDFLYGAATTIQAYDKISAGSNCEACHTYVGPFHGGGRKSFNTCATCHGVAGGEDWAKYGTTIPSTDTDSGTTINFRTMLHKIHMGEELTNASTYAVLGNSASVHSYGEVKFPALPGRTKNCTMCHGTADSWYAPDARQHASQTTPTREWRAACGSCHDSDSAGAHIDAMTSSGVESCETCHGDGAEFSVQVMHKDR